jgi:hypothetical protein
MTEIDRMRERASRWVPTRRQFVTVSLSAATWAAMEACKEMVVRTAESAIEAMREGPSRTKDDADQDRPGIQKPIAEVW